MPDTTRTFLALALPSAISPKLERLQARLEQDIRQGRLSTPRPWHITLAFLGGRSPRGHPRGLSNHRGSRGPEPPAGAQTPGRGCVSRPGSASSRLGGRCWSQPRRGCGKDAVRTRESSREPWLSWRSPPLSPPSDARPSQPQARHEFRHFPRPDPVRLLVGWPDHVYRSRRLLLDALAGWAGVCSTRTRQAREEGHGKLTGPAVANPGSPWPFRRILSELIQPRPEPTSFVPLRLQELRRSQIDEPGERNSINGDERYRRD